MKGFSDNQLERYPIYLRFFRKLEEEGEVIVSSPFIAAKLGYSEELVRKDLQAICQEKGRPRKGRSVEETIADLERFLSYKAPENAVLIGAGNLGSALLRYSGFAEIGLNIEAAFDASYALNGKQIAGKNVYPMAVLPGYIKERGIKLAILTVPASVAQSIAETIVKAGIEGIWNFAPIALELPSDIIVENVELSSSLSVLTHRIKEKREKK